MSMMKSKFQCLEFESDDDFKEMMPACWEAFEHPFNSYLQIVFYLKDSSLQERERSIRRATAMVMTKHARRTPNNSHWIKVIEPAYGFLVGAANWIYFERGADLDTATNSDPIVAWWWPEGIGRDYANNFLRQVDAHKYYLQCDRPYMREYDHIWYD